MSACYLLAIALFQTKVKGFELQAFLNHNWASIKLYCFDNEEDNSTCISLLYSDVICIFCVGKRERKFDEFQYINRRSRRKSTEESNNIFNKIYGTYTRDQVNINDQINFICIISSHSLQSLISTTFLLLQDSSALWKSNFKVPNRQNITNNI